MKNIMLFSRIFFIILLCALAFWLYQITTRLTPLVLTDDIYRLPFIENGVEIILIQRVAFGCLTVIGVCLGCVAGAHGLWLLNNFARGELFTLTTTRHLKLMGAFLSAAMIWDLIYTYMAQLILGWFNSPDFSVNLNYISSNQIFLLLCGMAFAGLGWVFSVARQLQDENKEFI